MVGVGDSPNVRIVYNPLYQCACSRYYTPTLGYFDFSAERVTNVQDRYRCNSQALEPMYVADVLPNGQLRLKCPDPNCSNHNVEPIIDQKTWINSVTPHAS